jgi:hypothetical protein
MITFILIHYSVLSLAQDNNLIKNGGFENGTYNTSLNANSATNFKHNLEDWKCRMKNLHNDCRLPLPITNVSDEKCKEDDTEENTTVYPNPFSSTIYLDMPLKAKETMHCQIVNMNGTVVFQKAIHTNNYSINTSSFSPGIYILKLISNNTSESYKIVKQ